MRISIPNILATLLVLSIISCGDKSSQADNDFDVSVSSPQLSQIRPKIVFDQSHKEHHHIESTYKPFAKLITNDGCVVKANKTLISKEILSDADIYVVVTAMGKEDPGDIPPFSTTEIDALEQWVREGGSVLLITEHYPFGLAMGTLLKKFGVMVHNGYTEDTALTNPRVMDALLFEKAKGNLNASHPIFDQVDRINTFTGSSIKGDSSWTPLLIFSPVAQNFNVNVTVTRDHGDVTTNVEYADFYPAKGYAQGICKQYFKGRIVVLAESAFLTAQTDKNGNKYGMNVAGTDNKQFALNMIRWLAKK